MASAGGYDGRGWRLPFDMDETGCCSFMGSSRGVCIQGNNSGGTHKKELRFSFDFSLPVGARVHAAADGIVVAAVDCFRRRGTSNAMRARANYIALRHGPSEYSRYYHLCYRGVSVSVGESVAAGQPIGRSGNTGFSTTPHLHFDVVDVLPMETSALTLLMPRADGSESRTRLESIAACFSGPMPQLGSELVAPAVWADPPTANEPLRNGPEALRGAIVLVDRCKSVDFIDKAIRAEEAGAAAILVVNFATEGVATLTMGLPKSPSQRTVGIPAVMVTHAAGKRIRAAIDSATSHLHPAQIVLGRSPHFRSRSERREDAPSAAIGQEVRLRQAEDLHVQSDSRGASDFVPLTLPVRFEWAAHPEAYLPKTGSRPPSQVLHGSGGEASRPPSTRTASSASQGPSEVARLSSGAAEDSPARGAVRLVRTTPHAMADELAVPPGGLSFTL
jgi:hypothetical protein